VNKRGISPLEMIIVVAILALVLFLPALALAQDVAPGEEITLGQYALPLILMVVLGAIYKMAGGAISDRFKTPIALLVGIGLSMVALAYAQIGWSIRVVIDYGLYGLMTGAAAVGLYELNRAMRKPRM
jgi:chromate transport protein ChrA